MIRRCSNARPERLPHLGEAPEAQSAQLESSLSGHASVIIVTYYVCVRR